ncbi:MAG: metal ABC transporter substrate-binding protein [Candidatus Eremiobacteraeota bacterium]|nr:metal ABC transporter substrate-binding protein [Candidatus Eremiobacteraeota bacterium]
MSLRRFVAVVLLGALAACSAPESKSDGIVQVVTTFSTLNSFVQAVGGAHVHVQNLVPIGASPEDYQPTPQDIGTLSQAQLLVENGSGIEAWLQHTIADAGNATMKKLVLSDGLPRKGLNPHLWMDPQLAKRYVDKIAGALSSVDEAHAKDYTVNAARYKARLDALSSDIQKQINTIPPNHRTMIVFHNAWQYYNDRFGLRTVGVIELSPGQEPNPEYIGHLVDLARREHVRAIFAEPEYSPKLVQTLASSAHIKTVENLYDDSVAGKGAVSDYISMLQYDTKTIVQALR